MPQQISMSQLSMYTLKVLKLVGVTGHTVSSVVSVAHGLGDFRRIRSINTIVSTASFQIPLGLANDANHLFDSWALAGYVSVRLGPSALALIDCPFTCVLLYE